MPCSARLLPAPPAGPRFGPCGSLYIYRLGSNSLRPANGQQGSDLDNGMARTEQNTPCDQQRSPGHPSISAAKSSHWTAPAGWWRTYNAKARQRNVRDAEDGPQAHRWKEIHWWLIDARCWKATYGPDTQEWAHCDESKTPDGEPWPEWTGKQEPHDHLSNRAREEEAREEMGRVCTLPDYEELVGTMTGERISIAADMAMAHLSIWLHLHVLRRAEEEIPGGREPVPTVRRAT
jgi:hypothetical protein